MNRRRFMTGLAGILAASTAPAFVTMGSLMVPRRVLAGETIETIAGGAGSTEPWDDTVPTLTIFRDGLKIKEMRLTSGWQNVSPGRHVTVHHTDGLESGRAYQYRITDRRPGGWIDLEPIA